MTCVTIHLQESLTHGGCGTARCAAPWKISLLGKAQNPQPSLCSALCPCLFASKVLQKRRLEEQRSVSNVGNTWWIIHSWQSKRLFPHSGYITILKDFHQVLCWLLQGSYSDLSMQLPLQHPSWFEWILVRLRETSCHQQECLHVPLWLTCTLSYPGLCKICFDASAGYFSSWFAMLWKEMAAFSHWYW